ncbi:hypothetical protein [Saccharibacillus kuerlensis]|uniref:AAA+ ATPase domain-containing protein n=1 Tax=Saccharibacillus kuerlensis TaxID=459527 RepID=A0ABQ2L1E3_9BACL|nr:hypothetical protein [Saccharibacillus kuerlensis]GGN99384.1 hypothetical protein GCM10010969_19440 [Saccharibacillus kuerlensis]
MRNLQIMLAVEDEQYIEPFLLYARTGEFAKQVSVRAFSKIEAFLTAMGEDRPDFVLGEPAFLTPWLESEGGGRIPWAALGGGEESIALGGPVLLPFQPLNLLLMAVMDLAGAAQTSNGSFVSGKAEVIAVHSAAPGAGKTTTALNLSKQLGGRGLRVFYLNLETVDSSITFRSGSGGQQGAEGGLPELLYDLRAAKENGEACQFPLSRYASFQEKIKAASFSPLDRPDELLQMNEADTVLLIDYIASSGMCDVVIVDTDTESHERSRAVLSRADRVLWLLADDLLHMRKTAGWMSYREVRQPNDFYTLLGKSLFVVNRYGGRLENTLPRPDLRPAAFLSYIPSWKYLSREDVLLGSPIFQRDILALCEQLGLDESKGQKGSVRQSMQAAGGWQ